MCYSNFFDMSKSKIFKQLTFITNQNTKIMASIDDLKAQVLELDAKVVGLQTTVDENQVNIKKLVDTNAQVVTDLNLQIEDLKAKIAGSATPEELQVIADGLTAISTKVQAVTDDVVSTVA